MKPNEGPRWRKQAEEWAARLPDLRAQALRKSEQMLEEDALRFDQFLKDNDQKAVQAIKKAEAETKAKAEKVQEIKKLNMQITQIK